MRKHFSQMSNTERRAVADYITHLPIKTDRQHYIDRKAERSFSAQEVRDAITTGDVVEVHNNAPGDIRALVRDDNGTCVVLSLLTGQVITVYYNAPSDTHHGLDWTPYRWQVDLGQVMRGLQNRQPAAA